MSYDERRWRLICYDVRDPHRYRRAYKILLGAGRRLQYSIFRAHMDDREVERLRWELSRVLTDDDALMVIDLCPRCADRVISRNALPDWNEAVHRHQILPTDDQASSGVRLDEPKRTPKSRKT